MIVVWSTDNHTKCFVQYDVIRRLRCRRTANVSQLADDSEKTLSFIHRAELVVLDIQLHVQSVPITTYVVSLNPAHGEVYSIQHYVIKLRSLTCDRSVVLSRYWENNILMNIKEFPALHVDTNGTALSWLLYISQLQFVAFYFISHNLNIRGPLLLLVTTCISSPFFELKRRSTQYNIM
jgi:hypothetical protein